MSENKPLKLVQKCYDPEEYGYLYKLNKEIPIEEFNKAKQYFKNFSPKDFKNIMAISGDPHGWMCTEKNIPQVEKALNITETMEKFKKEQAELHKKYETERITKDNAMIKIENAYNGAPRPHEKIERLMKNASKIYDPANGYRDNKDYGGGTLFIYEKDAIWYIMNNGRKEDNWNLNNIDDLHHGGAIGFKLPFNKELDELIKIFSEENEYKGE